MGPWATANYCRAGIKSLRGTAEPSLPKQLKDGSVLIMDKRVKISTKADDQDEKSVPNESPMAISFPKTSTCLTVLGKQNSNSKEAP